MYTMLYSFSAVAARSFSFIAYTLTILYEILQDTNFPSLGKLCLFPLAMFYPSAPLS